MAKTIISFEVMEYMVWLIEIVANKFFEQNKNLAYNTLKECGLWDIYVDHYETSHTLGKESILDEIHEYFMKHEVNILC